jgi:pyruvate dehydrogenase E1 component beta subunit
MMRELKYNEAINEALKQALAKDDRIFLMGEDIGKYRGVFGVSAGLIDEFGEDRVMDIPISETSFGGIAAGAAMTGLKPIIEIMFMDFMTIASDGIFNQSAMLHYISGGQINIPVIFRTTCSAGGGSGCHHGQSLAAWAMHWPGLKIAVPSTPYDAKGLLNAAIEDENPILFVEDRSLYGTTGSVPEEYYTIPFGKAEIRREGDDITIVAIHRMVARSLSIAEELAGNGISIEVIDPRTLFPMDKSAIVNSIKKTGRLIIVEEGRKTNGIGSEISAVIAEEAIDYLQTPIVRVAAPMTPVPASPPLEGFYVPNEDNIRDAVNTLIA